ncbi:MAG: hypothetical protein WKF35_05245 [Ferruginibacter sp.]
MEDSLFKGILILALYLAVDFLIYKYFLYKRKGLIQVIFERMKERKKKIK